MPRKNPESEKRMYTLPSQILSFVFYSVLAEHHPVLLEPQIHGEAIEKQTSSETEKGEERRQQSALPIPKPVILDGKVWKVTYYWKVTVVN